MSNTYYNAAQAVARAKSYGSFATGYCLKYVWTCLDYPRTAGLASANAAWSAAKQKVYSGNPPAGAPVYWGGGKYGHIAISIGNGYCRSTDYPTKGKVGNVLIATMTKAWGLTYRGWSRDYAGHPILGLQTAAAYPAAMTVDLNASIAVANLRPEKKNADVARFEKALWNYLGGAYRQRILAQKAAVGDGYYGTLTQQMCSDAYAKAGLTRATYPGGKVLLNKIGFKVVK